jgi:tRNA:m4X modification enzyme
LFDVEEQAQSIMENLEKFKHSLKHGN